MQSVESAVVQLPNELFRMRKSDELMHEWCRIQATLVDDEKIVAMYGLYERMERHAELFGYGSLS